ncbi:unnamed protein product, partial [Prorocentrum cordatum]
SSRPRPRPWGCCRDARVGRSSPTPRAMAAASFAGARSRLRLLLLALACLACQAAGLQT